MKSKLYIKISTTWFNNFKFIDLVLTSQSIYPSKTLTRTDGMASDATITVAPASSEPSLDDRRQFESFRLGCTDQIKLPDLSINGMWWLSLTCLWTYLMTLVPLPLHLRAKCLMTPSHLTNVMVGDLGKAPMVEDLLIMKVLKDS